jgi:hypothetical protein
VWRCRALLAAAFLAAVGCADDDDVDTSATTTTAAEESATTAPMTATTSGEAGLAPGDPCSLEEGIPDCIDPDGDGEGTYLLGGADCMAALASDPGLCEDLDGDGRAGYPDSG